MVTFSGGGRTREPGEMWNVQVLGATSFDDAGYVLSAVDATNVLKVDKCGATEIPYAVNYRSSRNPLDMNEPPTDFQTGTELGEKGLPVFSEGWAKLKLATDNAEIEAGEFLICTGGGKVDLYAETTLTTVNETQLELRFTELAQIVGRAEARAAVGTTSAASQDKILTHLTIGKVGTAFVVPTS